MAGAIVRETPKLTVTRHIPADIVLKQGMLPAIPVRRHFDMGTARLGGSSHRGIEIE